MGKALKEFERKFEIWVVANFLCPSGTHFGCGRAIESRVDFGCLKILGVETEPPLITIINWTNPILVVPPAGTEYQLRQC